ncbi:MAG: hypothetical protein JXX29_09595 [Deltaproteobacteria bacterium]|nr:hypothetical protein [Deltaproteobacteria bacterium]MBN2671918.1 hypothetical protein [Deltaproteobacteria bacterium]
MIDSRWTKKDELIDILMDLKHDLGKYVFLHLSHLTTDSPADMIEEALHAALFETRKIGVEHQSAEQIWLRYKSEIDALDYPFGGYERLVNAANETLAMKRFLTSGGESAPPHVGQIQKIARGISETIMQIIEEEQGE